MRAENLRLETSSGAPRVAIVHEWLDTVAGSERVLEQLLLMFPEADLFAIVDFLEPSSRAILHGRIPQTSFIQRMPWSKRLFRGFLALMPLAVEQFDLSGYDLIVSSSHAFAKGVLTGPDQRHVCYCHTPLRYAWDLQHSYLRGSGLSRGVKSWIVRIILHYLRLWDSRTANGVDLFIANSTYVARRIRKAYGRDAAVVSPPVDTEFFVPSPRRRADFYVTASRLVPYKRIDLVVEAFSAMADKELIVIGDGPRFNDVRSKAGPNVRFLGHLPAEDLRDYLQSARAFVFAAEEDFGIGVVEAQACGTPVICFGRGGVRDSVIDGVTGVFFNEQTPQSIRDAVQRFECSSFNPAAIRANSERFSVDAFHDRMTRAISDSGHLRALAAFSA